MIWNINAVTQKYQKYIMAEVSYYLHPYSRNLAAFNFE